MLIVTEAQDTPVAAPPDRRMDDLGLTEGELSLLKLKHFKTADRFTVALWECIMLADADDLAKLRQVYPEHIDAYRSYKTAPGWFENLLTRLPERRAADGS